MPNQTPVSSHSHKKTARSLGTELLLPIRWKLMDPWILVPFVSLKNGLYIEFWFSKENPNDSPWFTSVSDFGLGPIHVVFSQLEKPSLKNYHVSMAISWGKYEKMIKMKQKGGTLNFSIFFRQSRLSTMEKWVKHGYSKDLLYRCSASSPSHKWSGHHRPT